MSRILFPAALAAGLVTSSGCAPSTSPPTAPASPAGHRVLYVVTKAGCPACHELEKALRDPQVVHQLDRFDVQKLKHNGPVFAAPVTGYPTLIIAASPTGPELSRRLGAQSAGTLAEWLSTY